MGRDGVLVLHGTSAMGRDGVLMLHTDASQQLVQVMSSQSKMASKN